MKKLLLFAALFIAASTSASAQTPATTSTPRLDVKPVGDENSGVRTIGTNWESKAIRGGVLNGKASSLPRPQYPAQARVVRASGAVSVEVLIDEQGNVVSANAVSGHPLLRYAAEQAALGAKFSPTTLQGQFVKVSGIITYNFVTDMSFSQIGFDLALMEKSKEIPGNVFVGNITANIPSEWEKERSDLYLLGLSARKPLVTESEPNAVGQSKTEENKTRVGEIYSANPRILAVQGVVTGEPLDRVKLAGQLQKDIENRLISENLNLWRFKVGKTLGSIAAQTENEAEVKMQAAALNELILTAPSEISSVVLDSLRKLVALIETSDFAPDSKAGIKSAALGSRNL